MKKTFKSYIGIWAICFIIFNVIAFIVPKELKDRFWVGYIFISLSFVGQLFCSNIAFKSESSQKFFYNFPLISISFIGIFSMLVVGGLTMAISFIPVWLGIVVCIIVLAITAVAIINASVVSDVVSKVDVNIKTKSHFIRQLTADAQALMVKSTTADTQQITKKVYEVIRYSDPVSNEALDHIEAQIMVNFKEFQNAILKNLPNAMLLGEDLIILIEERNIKCRSLK